MANEQEAGAIIVALKAQIDSLEQGFKKAKATLAEFGQDTTTVSKSVEKGGEKISATFDNMDRRAIRVATRFAQVALRMQGMALAIQSLDRIGSQGMGRFKQAIEAGTVGLSTFASIAATFPNPVGLATGAVLGLAAGFSTVSRTIAEAEERARKLKVALAANFTRASESRGEALFRDITAGGQSGRLAQQVAAEEERLKRTLVARQVIMDKIEAAERDHSKLALDTETKRLDLVKRRETLESLIRSAPQGATAFGLQIAQINNEISELDRASKVSSNSLTTLRNSLNSLSTVDAAANSVKDLNDQLAKSKALDAYAKSMAELNVEYSKVDELVRTGVITPLKAEEERIDILNEKIKLLIENHKLLGIASEANGSVESAISRLESERADRQLQLGFEIDDQNQRQLELKREQAENKAFDQSAQAFDERFTEPFSQAIGFAVADGIMEGAKTMEIVANVGRNLFASFLNDSIKNFQAGMTAAFKGIAGAGGEILGSAFTAVAGIVGGILMNRESKATETFTGVKSGVESSQALRGIIAGPSNIAIASVGEDIGRAVAPVVDGIKLLAKIMSQVEFNTRGGGGAGGAGGPPAVAVPTA